MAHVPSLLPNRWPTTPLPFESASKPRNSSLQRRSEKPSSHTIFSNLFSITSHSLSQYSNHWNAYQPWCNDIRNALKKQGYYHYMHNCTAKRNSGEWVVMVPLHDVNAEWFLVSSIQSTSWELFWFKPRWYAKVTLRFRNGLLSHPNQYISFVMKHPPLFCFHPMRSLRRMEWFRLSDTPWNQVRYDELPSLILRELCMGAPTWNKGRHQVHITRQMEAS